MRLETHKKNITPKIIYEDCDLKGYKDHKRRARRRADIGAIMKGVVLARVGLLCSLAKSFSASAKGWGRPMIPTLFGPFRIWK